MKLRILTVLACLTTSSVVYSSDNKKCLSRLLPTMYEHDQQNRVLIGRYTAFIGSDDDHNRSCAWQKILDRNSWRSFEFTVPAKISIHRRYYLWRTYEVRLENVTRLTDDKKDK